MTHNRKLKTLVLSILLASSAQVFGTTTLDYEVNDGGVINLNAGTYTGTFTSTVTNNNSSADINTSGNVTLQGTHSGYFGEVITGENSTLSLNASTFGAYLTVGNSSYTANPSTLDIVKTTGVTLAPGASNAKTNAITMDKFGVLKITKNLTLDSNAGNIQMNRYDDEDCPKIWFYPQTTTPKITFAKIGSTIKTNKETTFDIDKSKNLYFDLTNAPEGRTGDITFTIATFADGSSIPALTGTFNTDHITGNTNNVWGSYTIQIGNTTELQFTASYEPAFVASDGTGYTETFNLAHVAQIALAPAAFTELRHSVNLDDETDNNNARTLTDDFMLNIGAYNLTGDNDINIAAGKTFAIKGTGTFDNKIIGNATTSTFQLINNVVLGDNFQAKTNAINLKLGDGTTATTFVFSAANVTKFTDTALKIAQFNLNASAILEIPHNVVSLPTVHIDGDGAQVKLTGAFASDGFTNNFGGTDSYGVMVVASGGSYTHNADSATKLNGKFTKFVVDGTLTVIP